MVSLLFSFRGRINRKQYWLGTTLAGLFSGIGQLMVAATSSSALVNAKEPAANLLSSLTSSALSLPLFGLVIWASLAVQFKRFHDRGRTGWIALAPMVVSVILLAIIIGDAFSGAPVEQLFSDIMPWFAALMVMGLAFFIDLGCLPSVEGTNKYGPPPGTPGPSEPSRPSGTVDTASALFGAQSAMDRAIAEARKPQPSAAPPMPAPQPAFAAAPARAPVQPPPAGFGRRVAH
ncbi:MAG: DUF805 domain-containing protein [Vitreimonas sp.]